MISFPQDSKKEKVKDFLIEYIPGPGQSLAPAQAGGQAWKSIRRIISTAFIRQIDDMRNVIMGAFYRFSQKLSFAAGWVDRFLQPHYNGLCK
ncbi:hypothetical protein M1N01_01030 [Thermodesulfovibrionales bacterium]|nr:hypothetical protein [Thermodesulfovibrionales bacterium]